LVGYPSRVIGCWGYKKGNESFAESVQSSRELSEHLTASELCRSSTINNSTAELQQPNFNNRPFQCQSSTTNHSTAELQHPTFPAPIFNDQPFHPRTSTTDLSSADLQQPTIPPPNFTEYYFH